jgi:hypothetical protein
LRGARWNCEAGLGALMTISPLHKSLLAALVPANYQTVKPTDYFRFSICLSALCTMFDGLAGFIAAFLACQTGGKFRSGHPRAQHNVLH